MLRFAKERLPLVSGVYITPALGAVTAATPAGAVMAWTGWRGLADVLALLTAACGQTYRNALGC